MRTAYQRYNRKRVKDLHKQEMRKKRQAMTETERVHLGRGITEAVCKQFQDFLGAKSEAPFELKASVFQAVCKVLTEGVEV